MGLSKRTNQRGAEILADAFKVSFKKVATNIEVNFKETFCFIFEKL